MKYKQIVPSTRPVTTIVVMGQPRHYFQSEALGKCRAVLAGDLPLSKAEKSHVDHIFEEIELYEQESAKKLSKGEKLAILMDCSDRLHKRWLAAWEAHQALPIYDVRLNATFAKLERIHKATTRITRKITQMLDE